MIRLDSDFSELAQFTGTSMGVNDVVDTPIYLDDLLRIAHDRTSKIFDMDTAAVAVATQGLNHMYEWGTVGINPAPRTPPLDPKSPQARLWVHRLRGGQRSTKTIEYDFRASKVPVPLPTPETAGVSEQYMSGNQAPKRRHFFYWKAPVMEFGMAVTIKPIYAQALWIPFYGNPHTSDVRAIKRNFTMTSNTVVTVPGEHLSGNFTAHWLGWWAATGLKLLSEFTTKTIDADTRELIGASGTRNVRKYSRGSKTKTYNVQVQAARGEAKKALLARSKRRAASVTKTDEYETGRWSK